MSQPTQKFSSIQNDAWSSFRNTLNIISGSNLTGFTILFLDPTVKQAKGSHINLDNQNLTIGRGEDCKLKYDERYPMVSREHCDIICENGSVFLKHNPAASNPTLVNGVEATFVHELRNGDELQFAYNGPKVRFNKAESHIKGMGITQRLNFAMTQATKPLKAIIASLIIFGLALIGLTAYSTYRFFNNSVNEKITNETLNKLSAEKQTLENKLDSLIQVGHSTKSDLITLQAEIRRYSERINKLKTEKSKIPISDVEPKVEGDGYQDNKIEEPTPIKDETPEPPVSYTFPEGDIYFIKATSLTVTKPAGAKTFNMDDLLKSKVIQSKQEGLWTGAALLTSSKQLVTARHVIQPWRFDNTSSTLLKWLSAIDGVGFKLTVTYEVNPISGSGSSFSFTSDDVKLNSANDKTESLQLKANSFAGVNFGKSDLTVYKVKDILTDWATIPAPDAGTTNFHTKEGLEVGARIFTFGLSYLMSTPQKKSGLMAKSDKNFIARYEGLKIDQEELKSKDVFSFKSCMALDKTLKFDFGKSGGPVFAIINGVPKPIGIVGYYGLARNCVIPFKG